MAVEKDVDVIVAFHDLYKVLSSIMKEMSGSAVPSIMQQMKTDKPPPTYNRTDKFTIGFQTLIDSFGIATYREVNPGMVYCWRSADCILTFF